MLSQKMIFPELSGFAIFDVEVLFAFKELNKINCNILEAFTTTDFGEKASAEGVAIPMIGIEEEYYYFGISENNIQHLVDKQIKVHSPGWSLQIKSETCTVCGIGYLTKFNLSEFKQNDKFLKFYMDPGWYSVEIFGGFDTKNRAIYELVYTKCSGKPILKGSFEIPVALTFD